MRSLFRSEDQAGGFLRCGRQCPSWLSVNEGDGNLAERGEFVVTIETGQLGATPAAGGGENKKPESSIGSVLGD